MKNNDLIEAHADRGNVRNNHPPFVCPICHSDARCLLRKMFINNESHSPFPHPQQKQSAYIFLLAYGSWMRVNEQYWTSAWSLWTHAVNKDRLLTSTLWRKPECNFRRSFTRWLVPAQGRRRLCKGQGGKKPKQVLLLQKSWGDSHALDSICHRTHPIPCLWRRAPLTFLPCGNLAGFTIEDSTVRFLKKSEKNVDSGCKDKETGNKIPEACPHISWVWLFRKC